MSGIKESIRAMAKRNHNGYGVLCTVDSITGSTCYCIPVNGDADIQGVKIVPDPLNTKWSFVPKVGSMVIVDFLSDSSAYVAMIGEIDTFYLNGSNYDGIVKVNDLVTKLNNAENKINALIGLLAAWTPVPGDGGAVLKTAFAALAATTLTVLTPTVKANLENTTVLHGNG